MAREEPRRPLRALVIDGGPTRAEAQRLLEEAGFTVSGRRRARAPRPFARESSSPPPRHPPRPLPQVEAVSRGTEALRLLGERLRGGEPGCDVILKTHDASGSANAVRFLRRLREVEALAAIPVGACPAAPPDPQLAWVCLPGPWRPPPASRGRPRGQAQVSPPDICLLLVAAAAATPRPRPSPTLPRGRLGQGARPQARPLAGPPRPPPAVAGHTLPHSPRRLPASLPSLPCCPQSSPPTRTAATPWPSASAAAPQTTGCGRCARARRACCGCASGASRRVKACLPPAARPACAAYAGTHAGCGGRSWTVSCSMPQPLPCQPCRAGTRPARLNCNPFPTLRPTHCRPAGSTQGLARRR